MLIDDIRRWDMWNGLLIIPNGMINKRARMGNHLRLFVFCYHIFRDSSIVQNYIFVRSKSMRLHEIY